MELYTHFISDTYPDFSGLIDQHGIIRLCFRIGEAWEEN